LILCIYYRFDKRITNFAEEKFGRDGIDVKTGYKVVKVSKDAITMQNPAVGDISVPYGMAVWSTGIGTRPFIVDFMKQIGQVNIVAVVIHYLSAVRLDD
jgi:NADH:ubiquinone reductase (non-electrogenic)